MAKTAKYSPAKLKLLLKAANTQQAINCMRGHGFPVPTSWDYTVRGWERKERVRSYLGTSLSEKETTARDAAIGAIHQQLTALSNQPLHQ